MCLLYLMAKQGAITMYAGRTEGVNFAPYAHFKVGSATGIVSYNCKWWGLDLPQKQSQHFNSNWEENIKWSNPAPT